MVQEYHRKVCNKRFRKNWEDANNRKITGIRLKGFMEQIQRIENEFKW